MRALLIFSIQISSPGLLEAFPLFLFTFPMSLLFSHILFLISTIFVVFFSFVLLQLIFSVHSTQRVATTFPCILGCWTGLTETLPSFFARTKTRYPKRWMAGRQETKTKNSTENYAIILLNVFNFNPLIERIVFFILTSIIRLFYLRQALSSFFSPGSATKAFFHYSLLFFWRNFRRRPQRGEGRKANNKKPYQALLFGLFSR